MWEYLSLSMRDLSSVWKYPRHIQYYQLREFSSLGGLDYVHLPIAVNAVLVLSADNAPPARACTAFECKGFFLAPSGAQGVTLSICLSVCPAPSPLKSQVSLRSVSGLSAPMEPKILRLVLPLRTLEALEPKITCLVMI